MKVTVLTAFKDKNTGEVYKKGQTLEITKKRFKEILAVAPLVEEVKEDE